MKVVTVDTTKTALAEMLGDVDVNNMKAADAKKLIEQAMSLLKEAE